METGAITDNIDVAQVVLYVFWIFFAGLIFYLRREDRREGYPLESEIDGKTIDGGIIYIPDPKTFAMPDGTTVLAPDSKRADKRPVAAAPVEGWPGAPLHPTGDPMTSAVGPGSYAEREDKPDVTAEGKAKIVPLRVARDFSVNERDPDPRGMEVIAADERTAGVVSDIWVDRGEPQIRYLEVQLPTEEGKKKKTAKKVLVPIGFARIDGFLKHVKVRSILAKHFANVPQTKKTTEITRLEEDKICAYYGAGTLYASPERLEPII